MSESPADEIEVLRRLLGPVAGAGDALPFVASLSRVGQRGDALLVILDEEHELLDIVTVVGGSEHLALLVEFARCSADARYLFLAVNRTGEVPADRPDDELLWLELKELAATIDLVLCDLFVLWGTKAFSLAEHAPAPAQWG